MAPTVCAAVAAPSGFTRVRFGKRTMTTPISPTKTAVSRKARTRSPRNMAARITVRSGAA